MKNLFRVAVLLTLPLFAVTACKKEEAAKPAASAPVAAVAMPTDPNDTAAWKNYLVSIVKQHMDGIRQRPYMYYVPAGDTPEVLDQVERQKSDVTDVVGRGILPGNMIAFGSPDSTRLGDVVIEAFKVARPASLKDVRVLFIGSTADEQRVRDAVSPTAADFVFVEAK